LYDLQLLTRSVPHGSSMTYAADWINHLKLARDMSVLKNINLRMTEDDSFLIDILLDKEVDSNIKCIKEQEKNSSFILCTFRILSRLIVNHSIRLYKLIVKNIKIRQFIFS